MMKQNKNYGVLTPDVQAQISMMAIVGALSGQLFFGVLGDEVRYKGENIQLCLFSSIYSFISSFNQKESHTHSFSLSSPHTPT